MFYLPCAYVSPPPGRRPRRSWPPSRCLRFSLLTSLCRRFAYVLPTLQETGPAASSPFIVLRPERRGAEKSEQTREENGSGDRSRGQPEPLSGGPRPQLSPIRNRPQRHPSSCGRLPMRWEARRDGPDQDHGGGNAAVIEPSLHRTASGVRGGEHFLQEMLVSKLCRPTGERTGGPISSLLRCLSCPGDRPNRPNGPNEFQDAAGRLLLGVGVGRFADGATRSAHETGPPAANTEGD